VEAAIEKIIAQKAKRLKIRTIDVKRDCMKKPALLFGVTALLYQKASRSCSETC
jgi:hypothetical protein